jgi:hypothetical protein
MYQLKYSVPVPTSRETRLFEIVFPVNGYSYLTILSRWELGGSLDYVERNLIGK